MRRHGAAGLAVAAVVVSVVVAGVVAVVAGGGPASGAPPVVYADIRVTLDAPSIGGSGPLVFQANHVAIGDGVELDANVTDPQAVSNPSGWCGGAYVDVSADLLSVRVGGGPGFCDFDVADFSITLDGAYWGTASLVDDTVFMAAVDPTQTPVLTGFDATGSDFAASWAGTTHTYMSGYADFALTAPTVYAAPTSDEPAQAPAPDPADGTPTFTG
jgi:hypothetical protein